MSEFSKHIKKAIQLLEQGETVGIPTETVYGLAANALNPEAVLKIFEAKNRPFFDPLIVHTASLEQAGLYAEFNEKAVLLAEMVWPGPLTLILPKKDPIPDIVSSGLPTVGIRIPAHPVALELLGQLSFPLAAPSANPFGYTSPTTAAHVKQQLGDKISMVLDGGPCSVGVESTIVSIEGNILYLLRPGGTPKEVFEEIGFEVRIAETGEKIMAPGTMNRHYSTVKNFQLFERGESAENEPDKQTALIRFIDYLPGVPEEQQFLLSPSGDLREAARNLFALMRTIDNRPEFDRILAWKVEDKGLGLAINDRLKRAAAKD